MGDPIPADRTRPTTGRHPRPVSADQQFFTPTSVHRHLGLYCLGVGAQDGVAAPVRHRVLDSYAAVLVRRGAGELASDRSGRLAVQAPTLFWLFPGSRHSYAPDRDGWSEQWVLFDGFAARSYEDLGYLRHDRPATPLTPSSPVPAIFGQILDRCRRLDSRTEVEIGASIHQLIVASQVPESAGPDGQGARIVARLRADACTPTTITEHARRLGLTAPTLREIVRRHTGSAPKEFVLQTRISQAKALLAGTDLLVSRIAREVGYDDPAYFSRIFTRTVGSSPARFRARQTRDLSN